MVRFVIDLAKAEQLGLFGNKQPSKGPMFPRPSAPAAGGGGTKWVQVPGFARKDGTQVKAHLRHVTQAKPGDAHYKPATGDTHESLHFHATFAAEAAKRDGDKGAEEQLRGIAQQAARGGLDRKWAKETLSTLKRSHHIIGRLEEKEAAVGPEPKAKRPPKAKVTKEPKIVEGEGGSWTRYADPDLPHEPPASSAAEERRAAAKPGPTWTGNSTAAHAMANADAKRRGKDAAATLKTYAPVYQHAQDQHGDTYAEATEKWEPKMHDLAAREHELTAKEIGVRDTPEKRKLGAYHDEMADVHRASDNAKRGGDQAGIRDASRRAVAAGRHIKPDAPAPPASPPAANAPKDPKDHAADIVRSLDVDSRWDVGPSHSMYPPEGYKHSDPIAAHLSFQAGRGYTPILGADKEADKIKAAMEAGGFKNVSIKSTIYGTTVTGWPSKAAAPAASPPTTAPTADHTSTMLEKMQGYTRSQHEDAVAHHNDAAHAANWQTEEGWKLRNYHQEMSRAHDAARRGSTGPVLANHVKLAELHRKGLEKTGSVPPEYVPKSTPKPREPSPAPEGHASRLPAAAYSVGTSGPEFEQRVAEARKHWNAMSDAEEDDMGAAMRGGGRAKARRALDDASTAWHSHPEHVRREAIRREHPDPGKK